MRENLIYICIPGASELVELSSTGEDDESDLGVAQHGELVSFLQQTVPPLGEGHLAVDLVLDPLQLNPPSPHPLTPTKKKKRKNGRFRVIG